MNQECFNGDGKHPSPHIHRFNDSLTSISSSIVDQLGQYCFDCGQFIKENKTATEYYIKETESIGRMEQNYFTKKDFIESKIGYFEEYPVCKSWELDKDVFYIDISSDKLTDFLTSSLNEAWEKGYEDGLSLRMNYNDPEMMERVRREERTRLRKWAEEIPTEFPERESDEYDNAYKDAKEYILIHLQELTK